MANGIVTPPDYRAAQGISNFTEGVRGGLGIVKDAQSIKHDKQEQARRDRIEARGAERDAREKSKFEKDQYDTHVKRVPKYLQSMVSAAYAGKDAEAADIANMIFLPDPKTGQVPLKALRVTKVQAEDGSPTVEIEYDNGTVFKVDPKNARNWANGSVEQLAEAGATPTGEGDPAALKLYQEAQKEADRLQRKVESGKATDADKKNLAAVEARVRELGVKAGVFAEEADPKVDPKTGKPMRADPSTLPAAVPGSMTEQERTRKGYGITAEGPTSATPAPVATTGPAAAAPTLAQPKTQAEFDALPSGAKYINPKDGKTYTKK